MSPSLSTLSIFQFQGRIELGDSWCPGTGQEAQGQQGVGIRAQTEVILSESLVIITKAAFPALLQPGQRALTIRAAVLARQRC